MTKRRLTGLALVVLLLIAGCGTYQDPPGTEASASSGNRTTMPDWLNEMATCMKDQGWDVRVDVEQNGIISDTLPASQQASFSRGRESCEKQVGRAPNDVPMTPKLASDMYDHLLQMKDCLKDEGFQSSEPPSRSTFVEDYMSGRPPWSPFLDVPPDLTDEEWHALLRKCPQAPSSTSSLDN